MTGAEFFEMLREQNRHILFPVEGFEAWFASAVEEYAEICGKTVNRERPKAFKNMSKEPMTWETKLNFGKYKNRTVGEVWEIDGNYVIWLVYESDWPFNLTAKEEKFIQTYLYEVEAFEG